MKLPLLFVGVTCVALSFYDGALYDEEIYYFRWFHFDPSNGELEVVGYSFKAWVSPEVTGTVYLEPSADEIRIVPVSAFDTGDFEPTYSYSVRIRHDGSACRDRDVGADPCGSEP